MAGRQRIVSLISSATEIQYILDHGERVVGVSHECDYPAEVAAKPRLTRALVEADASSRAIDEQVRTLSANRTAMYEIDVERLASLQPDLIITQAQCDVCAVRYEDVASAVRNTPALRDTRILALNPQSISDVLADIQRVAEATNDESVVVAATLLKANYWMQVAAWQIKAAEIARQGTPRVICLEWIDPPMVAANWMPEIVMLAGGEPGLTQQGRHSTYADWQKVVEYDPEVVVVTPCGFDLARTIHEAQVLAGFPGWSNLTAVREQRVYAVDGNAYFNRSGPRLIDSVEILGHLIQPEYFPAPQKEDAAQAWSRLETRAGALVPV